MIGIDSIIKRLTYLEGLLKPSLNTKGLNKCNDKYLSPLQNAVFTFVVGNKCIDDIDLLQLHEYTKYFLPNSYDLRMQILKRAKGLKTTDKVEILKFYIDEYISLVYKEII